WSLDNDLVEYATCGTTPYIYVGVLDALTLEPWKTHCPGCGNGSPSNSNDDPSMDFGNLNNNGGCRPRFEKWFMFSQTDATSMANFQNMITNGIPDSNYVVIY